jgi:two-component system, response regulator PdtaR
MSFATDPDNAPGRERFFLVICRGWARNARPDGESGMRATTDSRYYSILITDDDSQCREALREIMELEGFRTLLAASGEEAVDIVRDERVHLALLDMHMPRLTGLETLQMVRQINAMLPCILVTADASEHLMRQAYQARAYSVIPKPISKNVVLYTVVRALMRFYGGHQGDRPEV